MSDPATETDDAAVGSPAAYASAPEDALEPALRALVRESGAIAGAVCLFDPGEGVLRLAAEIGLSDEGCRLLRAVRPGVSPWEAPLTGLLEQRTLVVDDPGTVPPLADPVRAITAVACLPLFADGRPRGSVILVGATAHAFAPDAVERLAPCLGDIEDVVADIHRQVAAIARRSTDPGWGITDVALRGIEPLAREVGRLLQSLRRLPGAETLLQAGRAIERIGTGGWTDPDRVRQLEDSVYGLQVEARHVEATGLQRLADAEARWQARLAEATAAHAREQDRVRTLERAQERLAAELEETTARERRARQDLTAAIERGAADREETLRHAQELAWTAEQRRATAAADAESARAALGAAETASMRLSEEARQARAEMARLAAAEQAARATRDHAQEALEEVRRREEVAVERAHRFEADAETLRAESRRLEASAREIESTVEARWRSRLAETERAWAVDRQRLDGLDGEHARTLTKLEEITVREGRIRTELDTLIARSDADRDGLLQRAHEITQQTEEARAAAVAELQTVREDLADAQAVILHMQESYALTERGVADREETLRYALELKQKSDEARTAAVGEAEAVRTSLANVQGMILDAEEDARRARLETERVTNAAQAAFAARDRSEGLLDEARGREAELRTRVTELDQEARTLREECQRLEAAVRARDAESSASREARVADAEASAARERARTRELERELDRKTAEVAAARELERQAVAELAALREQGAYDRDEIVGRALELTQASEEARATAAAEAETIRTALAGAQALMLQAEDEARRARGEVERLESEAQAAVAERQQAARALAEARAREAEVTEQLGQAQAALAKLREEHQRLLDAPARPAKPPTPVAPARPGAAARPAAPPPAPSAGAAPRARVVTVIDGAVSWDGARGVERLEVLAPGPDLPARAAAVGPSRILVNLASPGALEAMAALRAAGCTDRFWGYLGAPTADRMLALGMIEVASHPIDADGLLAVMATYATRGTRVLTAGGDANALISLRQALTREGMSVSIAWDAKQAVDLLAMVRPEIAIIDLGLPPRGGYGIIAELAGVKPLPAAMLIPRGDDGAAGFAAALAERIRSEHAMTREQLLDHVLRGREGMPPPK